MNTNEELKTRQDCTCRHYDGQYVYDPNCKAHPDESELAKLKLENENFKTVMIAAAEEIQSHWQDHCDSEGYGPANLMRRLEKGIPAQYGYTAGAFEKLQSENQKLREALNSSHEVILRIYTLFNNKMTESQLQELRSVMTKIQNALNDNTNP